MKLHAGKALAAAALLASAFVAYGAQFALGQLTLVATYAIAGLGLVLSVGQAGLIVLGQAAFVAIGAYVETLLVLRGVPALLALPLATSAGAVAGVLASLPAYRLGGLYFGMATLAFALIVEEALVRAQPLTRGAAGLSVPALEFAGWAVHDAFAQAAFSAAVLLLALALCARLLRSRIGRAWRALRDDEIAAAALGIDSSAKMLALACGGALGGLAGALYAHWIGFISPEQFGLMFSFELLMLVFIGGARHLRGALWGALVMLALPQAIALLRVQLPGVTLGTGGIELFAFGAVIVAVAVLRPAGIAGGRQR